MENPPRPLRKIRQSFEWADYVESRFSVKPATNDELRINCFMCGDRNHKLYVNPVKRKFNCFKCGFSTRTHDVFDFVAEAEGLTRGQATMKLLREYKPVTPANYEEALHGALDEAPEPEKAFKIAQISGLPDAAVTLTPALAEFWDYLIGRGLTPHEITNVLQTSVVVEKNYLIYDHQQRVRGNIGRRILWPIYGGNNKMVSWMARAIDNDDSLKYLNCPDTDLNSTLWPYAKPFGDTVVLVEGVLDALAARRVPQMSAYATFGKAVSSNQMKLLEAWGVKKVSLAWDKKDAKKEMLKAVEELRLRFDTHVALQTTWPKEMDCGDCLQRADGVEYLLTLQSETASVDSMEYLKWRMT